ncbi:MAG: DUF721 domain-containing protein [Spirochaetales bacterium]|nr:DUF721 domain-containing protein [Spirochaetales bacterium]
MRESADIISQFFERDVVQEGEEWIKLISSWERIVGTDLSAHIKIKDLKGGTLLLSCDHPGWAQIFYMKKGAIMKKMRRQFPGVTIKSFRVLCDNKNINRELVENARAIEELRKEPEEEKPAELDDEFAGLLKNLRNLGD